MIKKILQRFSTRVSQWTTGDTGKKPYPFDEALTAIYEIGLTVIGADWKLVDGMTREDEWYAKAQNTLKASQRKAWAKACGVAE